MHGALHERDVGPTRPAPRKLEARSKQCPAGGEGGWREVLGVRGGEVWEVRKLWTDEGCEGEMR